LHTKLDALRTFAVSRLTKICELISHPESIDLARAVLAEHFGTFTLEPTIRDGEPVYLAHGNVDFLGDEEMAGGLPFVLLQRVPERSLSAMSFSILLADACGSRTHSTY
jgi:hypothetical protein